MRDIFACVQARVFGNPRSSILGLLVLVVLALMWLGADAIAALTAEVTALSGLGEALGHAWLPLAPLVLWLLGRRDRA
jgi:hypothetical protein